MFCWFEREGKYLRYESREVAGGYELRFFDPDGAERVEKFTDPTQLNERQIDFERQLSTEGWTGPHGWNL